MTETAAPPPDDVTPPPAGVPAPPTPNPRPIDWPALGWLAAAVVVILLLAGVGVLIRGRTHPPLGDALEACEHFVEDRLTLPNTAIFGDFDVNRAGDTYTVRGSVDSGTGPIAKTHNAFVCTVTPNSNDWRLLSMTGFTY